MIIAALAIYGIALGSFVNALVWRIHAQATEQQKKKPSQKRLDRLSISRGRSMCPHCRHELAAYDLIPVISWVLLRGKCRYCGRPISAQYPAVELLTGGLIVFSYIWWPRQITGLEIGIFLAWLVLLVGLVALIIYDFRWMLLPNRLVYPLTAIAAVMAALRIAQTPTLGTIVGTILAVVIGGGIFYILFQLSAGRWIGGGDVKLGWLLGLAIGTPGGSLLCIFLASVLGLAAAIPLLTRASSDKKMRLIPFGPFLIVGAIIVQIFGSALIRWHTHRLLGI